MRCTNQATIEGENFFDFLNFLCSLHLLSRVIRTSASPSCPKFLVMLGKSAGSAIAKVEFREQGCQYVTAETTLQKR